MWHVLSNYVYIHMHTLADPDQILMLLEDSQKLKYFTRTVKVMQVTLIKHSNIQVIHIISLIENQVSLQKPLKFTSGSAPDTYVFLISKHIP